MNGRLKTRDMKLLPESKKDAATPVYTIEKLKPEMELALLLFPVMHMDMAVVFPRRVKLLHCNIFRLSWEKGIRRNDKTNEKTFFIIWNRSAY